MSESLRDVALALGPRGLEPWGVRQCLDLGVWPALTPEPSGSIGHQLVRRFAPAGAALRSFANGTDNAWTHMRRDIVVAEIQDRLRDPAIFKQSPTDLCGPFAVLFELARRDPAWYVHVMGELFTHGRIPVFDGGAIGAADDLRGKPVPSASMASIDWMFAATIREEENVFEDLDDGSGIEGMTLPGAMERWVRDILGLRSELFECYHTDELEALQVARRAVDAGGVGFMLVDANLIKDGGNDDESDMHYRRADHFPRTPTGTLQPTKHSKDDAWPPDHWIVYLGGLTPSDPNDDAQITLNVWSWGAEFTINGLAEDLGEYLYAVVAGWP